MASPVPFHREDPSNLTPEQLREQAYVPDPRIKATSEDQANRTLDLVNNPDEQQAQRFADFVLARDPMTFIMTGELEHESGKLSDAAIKLLLDHEDAFIRSLALVSYKERNLPDTEAVLEKFTKDADRHVASSAAELLQELRWTQK